LTINNNSNSSTVTFEVCTDCEGLPFGPNEPDECGICDGDNSTCTDCAGIPNGSTIVDECGVCGGDNSTCEDCTGIPNGNTEIVQCGICGGDNSTCADCAGIPNGDTEVDECGICGGDNSTCSDCAGIPNGPNFINICGECSDSNPPFCNPIIPNPATPTPMPTPEPDAFNTVQIEGVTITSPEGTVISGAAHIVALCEKEIDGDTHDYPHEFFAYNVGGISAGEAIQVEYSFPDGSRPFDKFFMFGPTPDNPEPHCYEFAFDGTTGAQLTPDERVVVTIVDGGRGDSDLATDGTITNSGGPAVFLSSAVEADNSSNGGCVCPEHLTLYRHPFLTC